jgi:DNA-binding NarL/FixJ family response regulator
LRKIIEGKPDFEVVGEAGDGLELLRLVKQLMPHLVILDISMPNLRGIEAVREIRGLHPVAKTLILTMHRDADYLYQGISAGADGYILKEEADTELFSAIETIRSGGNYISAYLTEITQKDWIQLCQLKKDLPSTDSLTTREKEILKLIAEGKSSKDIADLLFISFRTVERHRSNIMEKLNIKKIADLVRYALQRGYA